MQDIPDMADEIANMWMWHAFWVNPEEWDRIRAYVHKRWLRLETAGH